MFKFLYKSFSTQFTFDDLFEIRDVKVTLSNDLYPKNLTKFIH